MKKIVCLLICLIFLTGCGAKSAFPESTTCNDIMQAAITATNAPDYDKIYTLNDGSFDASSMSLWADGLYQESEEYSLINDCAIYTAAGNITYEVGVIKPKDKQNIEKIKEIFENRKVTLSNGNKAAYDPDFNQLIKDCEIFADGDFVIFLLTDKNLDAKNAIEKLKTK